MMKIDALPGWCPLLYWLTLYLSSSTFGIISKDVSLLQCILTEVPITFLSPWEHIRECKRVQIILQVCTGMSQVRKEALTSATKPQDDADSPNGDHRSCNWISGLGGLILNMVLFFFIIGENGYKLFQNYTMEYSKSCQIIWG